ncbi:hypothetical protein BE21_40105, partial [Sorangium cellulosum]
PDGARELEVTAEGAGARASFRARLLPPLAAPALKQAEALRRHGKLDEAAALLGALSSSPDPATRALATGKLARVDLARGRVEDAIPRFEAAIRSHRAEGRISDEFLDRFALSYALLYNGRRFTEAREALDALGPLEASHAEGRAMKRYYTALVSFETGDLRSALRQLDASAEGAERLGMRAHLRHVLQQRADVLQSLGRAGEAAAPPIPDAELSPDVELAAEEGTDGDGGMDPSDPQCGACAVYSVQEQRLYAILSSEGTAPDMRLDFYSRSRELVGIYVLKSGAYFGRGRMAYSVPGGPTPDVAEWGVMRWSDKTGAIHEVPRAGLWIAPAARGRAALVDAALALGTALGVAADGARAAALGAGAARRAGAMAGAARAPAVAAAAQRRAPARSDEQRERRGAAE